MQDPEPKLWGCEIGLRSGDLELWSDQSRSRQSRKEIQRPTPQMLGSNVQLQKRRKLQSRRIGPKHLLSCQLVSFGLGPSVTNVLWQELINANATLSDCQAWSIRFRVKVKSQRNVGAKYASRTSRSIDQWTSGDRELHLALSKNFS